MRRLFPSPHRDLEPARAPTHPLRLPFLARRLGCACGTERASANAGLLAGLHEFPTAPNVPVTKSTSAHIEIADSLLAALLTSPPPPAAKSDGQTARRTAAPPAPAAPARTPAPLRVAKIVPAGDVLHIFSHIRKTYRVQWVVLEGGTSEEPPALVQEPDFALFGAAASSTSKGKAPQKTRKGSSDRSRGKFSPAASSRPQGSLWVHMEAVADTKCVRPLLLYWTGFELIALTANCCCVADAVSALA